MLSVLTLYLDRLNTATYVQPPTVRALIADPSNVNTLKSTRPSGFFFFFALWPDGDFSPRLALSPKVRDSLCLMSRGLRLRTPTEKSSEPQRPFTAITDYCVRWKQGMDLAGERQTYQRQPFSFRVHYLAFRFLSISFLLARADGARPAQAALWCRPPFRLCFPAPSLPCLLLHIPPPFTSNLSPPQFVILSLCLSGSPPPSSYLGTTTALCCHDSEGNVEARDQPTCF